MAHFSLCRTAADFRRHHRRKARKIDVWRGALVFVQPRTVILWQRKRFRDYRQGLSRWDCRGRPAISLELRCLIRRMWQANPTWSSPHIVGELQKLGIDIAKSTVEKYRPKLHKPSSPSWCTFLKQHIRDTVAIDFFTVPTARLCVLFVLVVLAHDRRRVVSFNVTEHPTPEWTAQQLVEAFPWESPPKYLLRDREIAHDDIGRTQFDQLLGSFVACDHQMAQGIQIATA